MARALAIDARDVTMRFGGVAALSGVNFELEERELRCLIGPNGAGKSTFFKCLAGLLTPTVGNIRIGGEDTTGAHPHLIARLGVGIKTQVPSVMNGLSVRENLWLAARRNSTVQAANQMCIKTIERLELGDDSNHLVETLSHGKRQLVELGIVLSARPWLVLLDEPAAGLTGDEVERMVDVIREINNDAALVIVEHDMHFVRRIADRVTVFHQGRVLIEAPVEEVMRDQGVRDVYLGKRDR
jgi:branched-chain amino acid transport system ATP-binding protein